MKCLILGAGYATRLYPLTENFPKPLLKVKDKAILDWLIDDIDSLGVVDEYVVISNGKFYDCFLQWAKGKSQKVTVVNDGTYTNETRLGAVKDIKFAVDLLNIKDDCLIIAGDNVLDFSLTRFIKYAMEKKTSCVMRYYEADKIRLSKSGTISIDGDDKVLKMEEKTPNPQSNWCCPPFYFYLKEDIEKIGLAIEQGCGVDAPGSLVSWLCQREKMHAFEMPGKRYDIGNLESYQKVQQEYKGIK